MDFTNIDPMLGQMLSQLIHFRQQVNMVRSVDTTAFMSALSDFSNVIGAEMQRQASGQSNWNAQQDLSAAVLQPVGSEETGAA